MRFVPLALRTVAVTARVVPVFGMVTGNTMVNVASERSGPALHNRLHRLLMAKKHMVSKLGTVRCTELLENVSQRYHGASAKGAAKSAMR